MILKTAANYNDEGGYIEAWKNSDGTTEVKLIPKSGGGGGDDEGKNGLLSLTISPAVTTTPALDSLFPIYWEDLPEGEIEEGVEYRNYDATLHTGHALTNGTEYSVTSTPSSEWHIDSITGGGDAGETVTNTDMVRNGALILNADAKDSSGTKCISVSITITE